MLQCSIERPRGVHAAVRSHKDCPRCGWTSPGPIRDALPDALEAAEKADERAEALDWSVLDGDGTSCGEDEALAAWSRARSA